MGNDKSKDIQQIFHLISPLSCHIIINVLNENSKIGILCFNRRLNWLTVELVISPDTNLQNIS